LAFAASQPQKRRPSSRDVTVVRTPGLCHERRPQLRHLLPLARSGICALTVVAKFFKRLLGFFVSLWVAGSYRQLLEQLEKVSHLAHFR
jgi:hypothetical protein